MKKHNIQSFASAIKRFSGPKLNWAMEALAQHGPEADIFGIEEITCNTYLVNLESGARLSQFRHGKSGELDAGTRAVAVRRSLATKAKGQGVKEYHPDMSDSQGGCCGRKTLVFTGYGCVVCKDCKQPYSIENHFSVTAMNFLSHLEETVGVHTVSKLVAGIKSGRIRPRQPGCRKMGFKTYRELYEIFRLNRFNPKGKA